MEFGRVSLLVVLALLVAVGTASAAPEHEYTDDVKEVIHGLKMGIAALKAIDKHEEAGRLERILVAWLETRKAKQKRNAGHDREIEIVKGRIRTLRFAMKALLEIDALDAAERMEHKIHSYELAIEGRRDEEAMRIRTSAPKSEAMVEPLRRAGRVWAELGDEKKAKMCLVLAQQYQDGASRKKPAAKEGEQREREMAKRHMEILRVAMHGFREAEKKDAAHRIEQVLHVYELAMAGKQDEARKAREKAPNAGQLAELLIHAGKIWDEFGHETKARPCFELGRFYQQRWHDQQAREKAARAKKVPRRTERDERLAKMEAQIERLNHAIRELTNEIERMRREK
jgi:hypothetical protein